MKDYDQTNFFKHTFCQFQQVNNFEFPKDTNYKSKSESFYFYSDEGVYRKSNHWGRVANCRWKLITEKNYKNQQVVVGFAKWIDFYPINSSEKIFFIIVNYDKKSFKIQSNIKNSTHHLFTFQEAQRRIKQIKHLFKDDKWTRHFNIEAKELKFRVISDFISSDLMLSEIKRNLR